MPNAKVQHDEAAKNTISLQSQHTQTHNTPNTQNINADTHLFSTSSVWMRFSQWRHFQRWAGSAQVSDASRSRSRSLWYIDESVVE